MLNLIGVELVKLRRRAFVFLMLLASLLMPFITLFALRGARGNALAPMQFYNWAALSYTPWIILPVVLGMLCAMLMADEHQYGMLRQLLIVPISGTALFLAKFAVTLLYSIAFMLLTALASAALGVGFSYIPFDSSSTLYLFQKCLETAVLTALAMLPILAAAMINRGYILPVCATFVYTFLGFILLMVNMYVHPLSSAAAVILRDAPDAVLEEPIRIARAFACIGLWDAASLLAVHLALKRKP